jgi:predicted phage-related endonuclease
MTRQEIQARLEEMHKGQYFTLRLYRSGEHQASITAYWNGNEYLITFEVFQTCRTTQQLVHPGAAALTLFEEARRWEEVVALELYEEPHPIF